jgi:predicted amidophosphoribosyltransferase
VATVEEYTDPFSAAYTTPPKAGPGVCDVCHNAPFAGKTRCWSCRDTIAAVSYPLELIVPISLYEVPSQLHSVLAQYKRSRDPQVRQLHQLQVAATLHRFVRDHGNHIRALAPTDWNKITIVPSKQPREGAHPLDQAIQLSRSLLRPQYEPLLEPWEPELIARGQSSDRGFRAVRPLHGERVLLVDDTFTSGGSFQSAASALASGGAEVVAGVVIGRVIRPDWTHETQALWDLQRAIPFDFDVCCLE